MKILGHTTRFIFEKYEIQDEDDLREALPERAMMIDRRERKRLGVGQCELPQRIGAVELSLRDTVEQLPRALEIHAASVSSSCASGARSAKSPRAAVAR